MLDDHSKVSIAQILFYIPAIILSAYLAFHRHKRPRMTWLIILFFALSKFPYNGPLHLYQNHT
jgi:hypothetical protein